MQFTLTIWFRAIAYVALWVAVVATWATVFYLID